MKAKTKKEGSILWVGVPDSSLSEDLHINVAKIGEKAYIIYEEGKIDFGQKTSSDGGQLISNISKLAAKEQIQSPNPDLSSEEKSLISKLSRIKFEERVPPKVLKTLGAGEQSALLGLIAKSYIVIFKSKKYPDGVYNISGKAYSIGQGANPSIGKPSGFAPSAPKKPLPSLPINTFEHLVAMGYMVLSSEYEARGVMPAITEKLKNDVVKGVRGFDKKYYVLRKSFLLEYEKPLSALLDSGLAKPSDMASKLNLTPEAVNVLLMILADEGDVIEKRRGYWAKA